MRHKRSRQTRGHRGWTPLFVCGVGGVIVCGGGVRTKSGQTLLTRITARLWHISPTSSQSQRNFYFLKFKRNDRGDELRGWQQHSWHGLMGPPCADVCHTISSAASVGEVIWFEWKAAHALELYREPTVRCQVVMRNIGEPICNPPVALTPAPRASCSRYV
jgi:hypothetical protein